MREAVIAFLRLPRFGIVLILAALTLAGATSGAGAADVTGPIVPGGDPVTVTTTSAGDNIRLTFSGTAGQRVFVGFSNNTISGTNCCITLARILKPDGTGLTSAKYVDGTNSNFIDTATLPTTGVYTILVDPQGSATGSITTTLFDVPPDPAPSMTPTQAGSSVSMTTTTSGQNPRPTFSGTAGQRVFVSFSNNTISGTNCCITIARILKPDGTGLTSAKYVDGTNSNFIDTTTLPTTGVYTILVDPAAFATGSITVTLYDVPPDPVASLVIGGAAATVTTTTPGQNARPTFAGSAGQPIRVTFTNVTIGSSSCCGSLVYILKPDGTALGSAAYLGQSGATVTRTLSVSGSYTVLIDAQAANIGSATVAVSQTGAFQPLEQMRGSCDGRGIDFRAACVTVSDPVNSLTGAFTTEVADVALPGVGVPFALTRSYDSSDPTVGRLGPGWADSYSASLAVQGNGDILVHSENGQQGRFVSQADGSFLGAAGATSTLSSVAGGYELVRHDQVRLRFDAQGRLSWIKDANDQGVTLTYGGDGKLATVTDAADRSVTFTHNGDGLLSQITLPDDRTVSYAYTAGRLTSVTDLNGGTIAYRYDGSGRLDKITDQNGHTEVENTYAADGRVTAQLDGLGNGTTFAWDATTQTATITDPRGNVWKDVYANNVLLKRIDALGNVTQFGHDTALNGTSVAAPGGQTTTMTYDSRGNMLTAVAPASLAAQKTFTYDANNNVTSVTDARGKVTAYTYDADGNITGIVQDGQTAAEHAYNAAGQPTSSTDGRGNTTVYTYDGDGNRASETDPLGNKTTYTYDEAGRVTSRVEPRGNIAGADPDDFKWTYTHDNAGNLLAETNPIGKATTYTYDPVGDRTSVKDPNNKVTTYTYDADNRLLLETAPDGGVTTRSYDAAGNTLTERNANNRTTTHAYDADNRPASVTTPLGNKTTYAYDANGNQTKVVDPRGNVQGANPNDYATNSTYDAAGRLLTQTDPLGNKTTYTYDPVGNRTSAKDANNHTTTYSYDGRSRLLSVTAPDASATTYTYDANGNSLTRTDARQNQTTYVYDAANRMTGMTLPLGRQWTNAYDAAGNRTHVVDAKGNSTQTTGDGTTSYTYDRAGQLTEIDSSGSTQDVSFAYDAAGNRASMSDGADGETRMYDSMNRVTQVARGMDAFAYVYDPAGNLTQRTYPDGTITNYTYDEDGRLASAGSAGQATTYIYDPAGHLTETAVSAGNGSVETRTYDRSGRSINLKNAQGSTVISQFAYTLDAVGNPLEVVRSGSAAGITAYGYDGLDRLTSVCFQSSCLDAADPFIRWTYDEVGNRLSEVRPSGTVSYAYDAADELIQAGSTTYGYDLNGNQISAGSRVFSYDLANRLTSTTSEAETTTYSYDGDGNRVQASIGSGASDKTNYVWDANGSLPELALERDGNGTLLRRYVYGTRRISMTAGGTDHYYAYDGLGSVTDVTSATGASEWAYAYEPFGDIRTEAQNEPAAPVSPMKFAGELIDPTGMYHLRARQYDPGTGRFTRVDPLALSTPAADDPHISSYVYADNQPTVLVDPTGMRAVPSTAGQDAARLVTSVPDARIPVPIPAGVIVRIHYPHFSTHAFLQGLYKYNVLAEWFRLSGPATSAKLKLTLQWKTINGGWLNMGAFTTRTVRQFQRVSAAARCTPRTVRTLRGRVDVDVIGHPDPPGWSDGRERTVRCAPR